MLLVAVLAVGQEQPSVVQHFWAIMGKMGPRWACTGPFTLLGPLLSLRSGPGQARPWVLWLLASCVTLGKLLNFSEVLFSSVMSL